MSTAPSPSVLRHHLPTIGADLEKEILATPKIRPAHIDDLVLEESVLMVSARPGMGKSCLLLSMVSAASMGVPAYGALDIPRPLRVYIFCPERSGKELRERIARMRERVPFNTNQFTIDDGMTGIVDISSERSREQVFKGVESVFPGGIDLFCVEGMYGMTRKPLASEEAANEFYRFNAEMQTRYPGCAIWYSHHTKKTQRDDKGKEMPDDWFGSQFLMANVTGAYLFERLPGNKSRVVQKKDTVSGLADELVFDFDKESFTMTLEPASPLITLKERFRSYANACFREGKTFSYDDLASLGRVSSSTLQRQVLTWVHSGAVSNLNPSGKKGLYKVNTII
jgi:hypothetical protein